MRVDAEIASVARVAFNNQQHSEQHQYERDQAEPHQGLVKFRFRVIQRGARE